MRKILIVDDDPDILELIEHFLESHKIEILKTTEGSAVYELVLQHEPDLILLDIVLPDIDGLHILRALRSNPLTSFVPVIMLTGQTSPNIQIDGLVSGADDYVTKPFDLNILYARILSVLRRSLKNTRSKRDQLSLLKHIVAIYEKRNYHIFSKYLQDRDNAPPNWKGYQPDLIIRKGNRIRCFSFETSQTLGDESLLARFREMLNISTYLEQKIEITIVVRSVKNFEILNNILKENNFPFKSKVVSHRT